MTSHRQQTPQQQQEFERRKAEERVLTERYKSDINLVGYLVDQGWQPIRGKHTRNWAALEDPTTGRKLMVHRVAETGHYAYRSFQDHQDKGTIINLVAEKLDLDLGKRAGWISLHAHLSPLVGNLYANHEVIRPVGMKDLKQLDEQATAKLLNIQPLQDRAWLHSRHLSDRTIDAPEFQKQIVQRPFETQSGYQGVNTAFPFRNLDHIVTLNTRGPSHNMMVSPKQDGVWMSSLISGVKPKELLLTENPIDGLSYHELHSPKNPGERVYLSSGGQPGGLQLATLQTIINTLKPERVILGNDNDLAGIRFNIQYMGHLRLPQQPQPAWLAYIAEGNQKTGVPNQLRLTLPSGREAPPGQRPEGVADRADQVMNAGHMVDDTKARVRLGKNYLGDTEITIDIPNTRPMLIRAENLTKEIRQTGELFVVKRSVEKDFNDDLKVAAQQRNQEKDKIRAARPEHRRDEPVELMPDWLKKLQDQFKADETALVNQKTAVKVGPTGLPMYQYEKGAVDNQLPNDGPKRIRKETSTLVQPVDTANNSGPVTQPAPQPGLVAESGTKPPLNSEQQANEPSSKRPIAKPAGKQTPIEAGKPKLVNRAPKTAEPDQPNAKRKRP